MANWGKLSFDYLTSDTDPVTIFDYISKTICEPMSLVATLGDNRLTVGVTKDATPTAVFYYEGKQLMLSTGVDMPTIFKLGWGKDITNILDLLETLKRARTIGYLKLLGGKMDRVHVVNRLFEAAVNTPHWLEYAKCQDGEALLPEGTVAVGYYVQNPEHVWVYRNARDNIAMMYLIIDKDGSIEVSLPKLQRTGMADKLYAAYPGDRPDLLPDKWTMKGYALVAEGFYRLEHPYIPADAATYS